MSSYSVSPTDSTSSIEVCDAIFCEHGKEVCNDCNFDAREENDSFFGLDVVQRDPLELPPWTKNAKDGAIECKKHKTSSCGQCFGWKKQLAKLHKDGAKNAKRNKKPESNLFV